MADITTQRATPEQVNQKGRKHLQIPVASGQTLYHGTIAGFDSSSKAAKPGSGVFPVGRVACKDGVSASGTNGDYVDIEEGSFSWDILSPDVLGPIGSLVYAASNHEVTVHPGGGQAFATYEGTFDGVPFFLSGFGSHTNLAVT